MDALTVSAPLVGELMRRFDANPGRWTAVKFLTYITAHEAHHRSQIEIALRLGGFEPPDEVLYRLWDVDEEVTMQEIGRSPIMPRSY